MFYLLLDSKHMYIPFRGPVFLYNIIYRIYVLVNDVKKVRTKKGTLCSPQVNQIGGKVTRKSLNLLTIVEFRIV